MPVLTPPPLSSARHEAYEEQARALKTDIEAFLAEIDAVLREESGRFPA